MLLAGDAGVSRLICGRDWIGTFVVPDIDFRLCRKVDDDLIVVVVVDVVVLVVLVEVLVVLVEVVLVDVVGVFSA